MNRDCDAAPIATNASLVMVATKVNPEPRSHIEANTALREKSPEFVPDRLKYLPILLT